MYVHPNLIVLTCSAFVVVCALSSAVYAYNDSLDYEVDRVHPIKCARPVASGKITPCNAQIFSALLGLVALSLAWVIGRAFFAYALIYALLNISYSLKLKHIPYVDICCIASGFVLRMLAGAAAIEVKTSFFLFATVFFLSLFMAAGKRGQELKEMRNSARHVLGLYSQNAIKVIEIVSMVLCCALYAAWVYATYTRGLFPRVNFLTIPLVVLGFYVYYQNLTRGAYGDPTEIIYSSRTLQFVLAAYVAVLAVALLAFR